MSGNSSKRLDIHKPLLVMESSLYQLNQARTLIECINLLKEDNLSLENAFSEKIYFLLELFDKELQAQLQELEEVYNDIHKAYKTSQLT